MRPDRDRVTIWAKPVNCRQYPDSQAAVNGCLSGCQLITAPGHQAQFSDDETPVGGYYMPNKMVTGDTKKITGIVLKGQVLSRQHF